jgi:ribokinase
MPGVVVVGSTNVDVVYRVARLPQPGETVPGRGVSQGFGGKGANQAVMAARLGAKVTMISAVGDDAWGAAALGNFREQGVDCAFVRTVPGPTGNAAIFVDDAAQNVIVVVPGANALVTAEQVRSASEVIAKADVVVAQLETPIETTLEAFRLARAALLPTLLNPAPAAPLPDELLTLTSVCIPNESELQSLTGLPTDSDEEATTAARALCRRGPTAVMLTRGAKGALLVQQDLVRKIPALKVNAVDPTAAGDAFVGTLAFALGLGEGPESAAQMACVVAAMTVTKAGAQASFPSREEIRATKAGGYSGGTP